MHTLIAFFSGIGVSFLGHLFNSYIQDGREKRKQLAELRFKVYTLLMGLYNEYFWVTVAEFHKEPVRAIHVKRSQEFAWKIADTLRLADALTELPQLVNIIFSNNYKTAIDRHNAMGRLLDQLGTTVNPMYRASVAEVSEDNLMHWDNPIRTNAPANLPDAMLVCEDPEYWQFTHIARNAARRQDTANEA